MFTISPNLAPATIKSVSYYPVFNELTPYSTSDFTSAKFNKIFKTP